MLGKSQQNVMEEENQHPDMGEAFDALPGFVKAFVIDPLLLNPIKRLYHSIVHPEEYKILKDKGADDSLSIALTYNLKALLHLSIAAGADVNRNIKDDLIFLIDETRFSHSLPVLHYAHNIGEISALIEAGAYVDGRDTKTGNTLLYNPNVAKPEIVQALIARKTDVNSRNNEGNAPLHNFCNRGKHWCRYSEADCRKDLKIIEMLKAAGADVNARNNAAETPLHQCFTPEIINLLIKSNANVDARDNKGMTRLHTILKSEYICRYEYHKIVELLLNAGADVNLQDEHGNTPLHYALSNGQLRGDKFKLVKTLLDFGANPYIKNNDGETAIDIGQLHADEKVAHLLRKEAKFKIVL